MFHPAAEHGVRHVSSVCVVARLGCIRLSPPRSPAALPSFCGHWPPCRDFLASRPGLVPQADRSHLPPRVATLKPASSIGSALLLWRLGQVRPAIAEAEIRSQHFHHSRWRTTLRSFSLASSIVTSPRPLALSPLGSHPTPPLLPRFRARSGFAWCVPSTSGPCSTAESVARPGVAAEPNPMLPWVC